MALECPVCFVAFDEGARLPKVLACGHTTCLHCLQGLREKRCPMCRQVFENSASRLATNFYLVGLLQLEDSTSASSSSQSSASSAVASLLELDASKCRPRKVLQMIRESGVLRLKALECSFDPVWAADVLRAAAPLLEELQLLEPTDVHLGLAHGMPRLRRLFVEGYEESDEASVRAPQALRAPGRLETLAFARGEASPPLPLLQAMLRGHGGSLRTLQLHGDGRRGEARVDSWIGECGLTALRHLLVCDAFVRSHRAVSDSKRRRVLGALKDCLPDVTVVWYKHSREKCSSGLKF